jgi:hypothetical protein
VSIAGYSGSAAAALGTTTAGGPVALAEAIIEAAKDRAYVGKPGLAVTVNYR